MKKILLLILLLIITSIATAQSPKNEEALITDRPDATESPYTVGTGNFQIEAGALFTDNGNEAFTTETIVFNTGLIRYGINEIIELRLGWDYLKERNLNNGTELSNASGFTPLLLGAKFELVNENGWIPQIGLLTHLRLPFSAAEEFKPENTGMEMIFSFDHTLSDKDGIAYNLGARIADDRSLEYLYTLAYGYSFTDKWGAYAELYGAFPEDTTAYHLWDAGITYLVNNNLQLDVTVGTSFQSSATDQNLLISAGLSYRVLKK